MSFYTCWSYNLKWIDLLIYIHRLWLTELMTIVRFAIFFVHFILLLFVVIHSILNNLQFGIIGLGIGFEFMLTMRIGAFVAM